MYYCKRCTNLYTLDVKTELVKDYGYKRTVFFACPTCGYEEDIPFYIDWVLYICCAY